MRSIVLALFATMAFLSQHALASPTSKSTPANDFYSAWGGACMPIKFEHFHLTACSTLESHLLAPVNKGGRADGAAPYNEEVAAADAAAVLGYTN